MQSSPTSCLFIPLWSKYSPQHPVLKHPQSMFLSKQRESWEKLRSTDRGKVEKCFHFARARKPHTTNRLTRCQDGRRVWQLQYNGNSAMCNAVLQPADQQNWIWISNHIPTRVQVSGPYFKLFSFLCKWNVYIHSTIRLHDVVLKHCLIFTV
jgi:hypothetical protein